MGRAAATKTHAVWRVASVQRVAWISEILVFPLLRGRSERASDPIRFAQSPDARTAPPPTLRGGTGARSPELPGVTAKLGAQIPQIATTVVSRASTHLSAFLVRYGVISRVSRAPSNHLALAETVLTCLRITVCANKRTASSNLNAFCEMTVWSTHSYQYTVQVPKLTVHVEL